MATATMTQPAAITPPSKLLALSELPRALFELGSLPWASPLLKMAPDGDGHPVIVLPGFMASDSSTRILRRFLDKHGYDTHEWKLGRNLGPKSIGAEAEHLIDLLDAVHTLTGKKVSIVGWSLGGVMARQLSRRRPDAVRQVISLGSPFAGHPRATTVWKIYERLTGHKIDDTATLKQLEESELPPPVPSTAIYSKADGIVAWEICREPEAAQTDNIEVYGSHCGLGVNASVLYAVAERLAQDEDDWKPFDRKGLRGFVYPSSGH